VRDLRFVHDRVQSLALARADSLALIRTAARRL
jgi:hypothetical protein